MNKCNIPVDSRYCETHPGNRSNTCDKYIEAIHEALHDAMLYEYSDYPTGFKTADDFIKNTCGFCEEDPQ